MNLFFTFIRLIYLELICCFIYRKEPKYSLDKYTAHETCCGRVIFTTSYVRDDRVTYKILYDDFLRKKKYESTNSRKYKKQ